MTKENILKVARVGGCYLINCGGVLQSYIVRHVGDSYLECEYMDKSAAAGGGFDCRIGFRSISGICSY